MVASNLRVTDDELVVHLTDGRTITAPLAWFPRLLHGRPDERANWRLIAKGEGIHWPELDEDITVQSLLAGHLSNEKADSLRHWLQSRDKA